MRFSFHGKSPDGEDRHGEVSADTLEQALKLAESRIEGITVIDISPVSERGDFSFRAVRSQTLLLLLTQLAYFLKAGIPLITGIAALEKDYSSQNVRKVLGFLRLRLEEGKTFGQSLAGSGAFPEMLVDLVRAGEETGRLSEMLISYTDYAREMEGHRSRIIQALVYPALVMVVLIGCVAFLSFFVFPKFIGFFISSNIKLPALTQGLYTIITSAQESWRPLSWLAVLAATAVIIFHNHPSVRLAADSLKLRLPLFGRVEWYLNLFVFLLTFHLLYKSGLRFRRISELLPASFNNRALRSKCRFLQGNIETGESMSEALEKTGVFPSAVLIMVKSGEKSGTLEDMLSISAQSIKQELDFLIGFFLQMLEPFLLIIISGIVSLFALAILLPMLDLIKIVRM
ncbi:MAG: type II secretion system F family protein [Candidatus Wallbacteria bacterium]|nr:type II secretion system F family protein [Candidatus Wallbacteria bacterium]